jgi:hypothetical protein
MERTAFHVSKSGAFDKIWRGAENPNLISDETGIGGHFPIVRD